MVTHPTARKASGTRTNRRNTPAGSPPRAVMSTPITARVARPTATLLQHRHTARVTAVSSSLGRGDTRRRRD